MTAVLAAARDVGKRFAGVPALADVTLEIRAGEVHCLVGENGAGKSTLVKLFAGVHKPDAGTVDIRGGGAPSSPRDALGRGVSTIFQELTLVPHMTVAENVALGAEPTRCRGLLRDRRALARAARDALDRLGVEGIAPDDTAGSLGIAQQQLLEIAKSVARADERILIMDEPTAPLTPDETERLFAIVDRLRARGLGILYITHRLEELPRIGDRVTVMRDGRVVASGAIGDFSRDDLIERMVGRKLTALFPRRDRPPGDVVAEVTAAPGGDPVLTVGAGEVVGLFGLVGSGRTELLRSLIGADRANGHRLRVDGRELRASSPAAALRRGVALVPEDRKAHGIVPQMSVAANISLSSLRRFSRGGLTSARTLQAGATPWAARLRVRAASMRQPIVSLSGGNQQKCVLARVLAADPRLIVLDEPTRGIDVGARAEVYALVNEICATGAGVLLITSDLPEALGMSDRIYVMRAGRIVAQLPAAGATERDVLRPAIGDEATTLTGGE